MKILFEQLKNAKDLLPDFTWVFSDGQVLAMNSSTEDMIIEHVNNEWRRPIISKVGNKQLLAEFHGMHIVIDNCLDPGIIEVR